ncbi:hypothetical protein SLE2022_031210 [Rubroshorea leprosula]
MWIFEEAQSKDNKKQQPWGFMRGFGWSFLIIAALLAAFLAEPTPIAKPGCQDRCGNVSIPYPFSTIEGCYYNDNFLITRDDTFDPPLVFLANSTINVTNVDPEGKLHMMQFIAHDCYDKTGASTYRDNPWLHVDLYGYTISDFDNNVCRCWL